MGYFASIDMPGRHFVSFYESDKLCKQKKQHSTTIWDSFDVVSTNSAEVRLSACYIAFTEYLYHHISKNALFWARVVGRQMDGSYSSCCNFDDGSKIHIKMSTITSAASLLQSAMSPMITVVMCMLYQRPCTRQHSVKVTWVKWRYHVPAVDVCWSGQWCLDVKTWTRFVHIQQTHQPMTAPVNKPWTSYRRSVLVSVSLLRE